LRSAPRTAVGELAPPVGLWASKLVIRRRCAVRAWLLYNVDDPGNGADMSKAERNSASGTAFADDPLGIVTSRRWSSRVVTTPHDT
jgi:hypothetical protein